MLMGMCRVEKDGDFSIVGDPRVLYSTMMLIRMHIVKGMNTYMFGALTIAFRYASVRRQFSTIHNQKVERPILDY